LYCLNLASIIDFCSVNASIDLKSAKATCFILSFLISSTDLTSNS
jgi:hypothetical protein